MMKQSSSNLYYMSSGNKKSDFIYSDEQLIAQFQSGNETAYIELVNRYRDRLINFVFQFLGDFEKAEDVVQDTMLKLYEKKHYYKEIAKFSTWLYTIARNLANTELRKQKRRRTTLLSNMSREEKEYELPAIQPDTGAEVQSEYVEKQIQNAIHALPEHFKTVIILRDIQELSYDEISSIVDVPIGTIKSRINRARLQLQADLKELR